MRCPMRCPACGARCGMLDWRLPQFKEWQCRNRCSGKIWSVHDFEYEELARAAELARADVLAPHPLEAQKRRVVAAALEKEVEERKAEVEEREAAYRRQEDAKQSPTEQFIIGSVGLLGIITVIVGLFALLAWCSPDNSAKCERFPELCVDYPVYDDPRH